jgi:uncharacterized protein
MDKQQVIYNVCHTVRDIVKNWDMSHDYNHARRVGLEAMKICCEEKPSIEGLTEEEIVLTAVVAGLVHDVIDHKYHTRGALTVYYLCQKLLDCGVEDKILEGVVKIIENMSFSHEKKFGVNYHELGHWGPLRDIVSDADKIDALGKIGIERCAAYCRSLHPERSDELIVADVVEHCHDKLLRLTPTYIKTVSGKKIALPLHQEIVSWVVRHER